MGVWRTEDDYDEWEEVLKESHGGTNREWDEYDDGDEEQVVLPSNRLGLTYSASYEEPCDDDTCVERNEATGWAPNVPPSKRRVFKGYDLSDALTAFLNTSSDRRTVSSPGTAVKSQPRLHLAHSEAPWRKLIRGVDQDDPLAMVVKAILILPGVAVAALYLAYPILLIPTVLITVAVLICIVGHENSETRPDVLNLYPPRLTNTGESIARPSRPTSNRGATGMVNYGLVRQAVLTRQQIVATYHGHPRRMCPHVIGTKSGRRVALFYQFGGSSSSGLPRGGAWRCIAVDQLTDISVQDGEWHTGTRHSQPQTCVDAVDVKAPF